MGDVGEDSESTIRFAVKLDTVAGLDERWLQDVTSNLKRELAATSDAAVTTSREDAPDGAKGFGGAILGELLVDVLPEAVGGLVQCLSQWLQARHGKVVNLKFERDGEVIDLSYNPSGSSSDDVKEIISLLMAKTPREAGNE